MAPEVLSPDDVTRQVLAQVAACPHLNGYDPVAPQHVAEPFPLFEAARRDAPIFYMPEQGMWCVTRHADILDVLRDAETYSSEEAHIMKVALPPEIVEKVGPDYVFPLQTVLAMSDPPRHTRVRKLIQPAFTPKALSRFEPAVEALVNGLIDDFVDAKRVELVEAFTRRVPALVMATIIGAPLERSRDFQRWVPSIFQLTGVAPMSEAESIEAWNNVISLERFVRSFIAERRAQPTGDLTSDLIRATGDDGEAALTDQEILANIIGFIGAGSDTTHVLLAHTLYLLLEHPEQFEQVKADPSLIPKAIEEALRFRSPAVSVKRTTTRETVLGGVQLPAGSDIWVHVASGNRDDSVFDEPARFDINRSDGGRHLAFGIWTHFCVGAPLARMESRIALQVLLERIPDIHLAPTQEALEYTNNMVIPDLQSLEVEWS
jgi:cytochrome P450